MAAISLQHNLRLAGSCGMVCLRFDNTTWWTGIGRHHSVRENYAGRPAERRCSSVWRARELYHPWMLARQSGSRTRQHYSGTGLVWLSGLFPTDSIWCGWMVAAGRPTEIGGICVQWGRQHPFPRLRMFTRRLRRLHDSARKGSSGGLDGLMTLFSLLNYLYLCYKILTVVLFKS